MTPEEVWLNYFNRILFEKGIIDDNTRNKMNHLIYKKYHKQKTKNQSY